MENSDFRVWLFYGVLSIAAVLGWYHLYQWVRSGFDEGVSLSMEYGDSYQIHLSRTRLNGIPLIAIQSDSKACEGYVHQLSLIPQYQVNGRKIDTVSVCYEHHRRSDMPINPEDAQYLYDLFLTQSQVTYEINNKRISFSTRGFQNTLKELTLPPL